MNEATHARGLVRAVAVVAAASTLFMAPRESAACFDGSVTSGRELVYSALVCAGLAAGAGVALGVGYVVASALRHRRGARRRAYDAFLTGLVPEGAPPETSAPAPASVPAPAPAAAAAPASAPPPPTPPAVPGAWMSRSAGLVDHLRAPTAAPPPAPRPR